MDSVNAEDVDRETKTPHQTMNLAPQARLSTVMSALITVTNAESATASQVVRDERLQDS